MQTMYEAARQLAVSWALNGPGTFETSADRSFNNSMNTLLRVFVNSVPPAHREQARERAAFVNWMSDNEVVGHLENALEHLVNSPEIQAKAPILRDGDNAFLVRAADVLVAMPTLDTNRLDIAEQGKWLADFGVADHREKEVLTAVMMTTAQAAREFQQGITEDVHAMVGADPEPLRTAVENLKLTLDAAEPLVAGSIQTLEPALNFAQAALTRYAHDGRMIMAAEDKQAVPAIKEAIALQQALDEAGFQIPNALWMDYDRQKDVLDRGLANGAVKASLDFVDATKAMDFVGQEQNAARAELNAALKDAGYLLPGESEVREGLLSDQTARGTDDQIVEVLGRAAEFARTLQGGMHLHAGPNQAARDSGAFGQSAAMLAEPALISMVRALQEAKVTTLARAHEVELVTGTRPFDFGYLTKERIEGMKTSDAEVVVRHATQVMLSDEATAEAIHEIMQYKSVMAKNDIEAVARFTKELADDRIGRNEVTVVYAPIDFARLEDIELGRADTVLGQNADSVALTKGEAELVMQLIEATDRIVTEGNLHPQAHENVAFSVAIGKAAQEAAKRIVDETNISSVLARVANGRQDAIGLSPANAKALNRFIDKSISTIQSIVIQNDDEGLSRLPGKKTATRGDGELSFGSGGDEETLGSDPLKPGSRYNVEEAKLTGRRLWDGIEAKSSVDKLTQKSAPTVQDFIVALSGRAWTDLGNSYETMISRGAHLVVAAMAGREDAPSLASLSVGIDPVGYGSVQEAMGMGMGGRDGKTKASLMEDRAISNILKPKMEMSWNEWNVLPANVKASARPYFMDVKVDSHFFPMPRSAADEKRFNLATTLEKADWSNTAIGNKLLVQGAISGLRGTISSKEQVTPASLATALEKSDWKNAETKTLIRSAAAALRTVAPLTKDKDPEYMKKPWMEDLSVNGSGRNFNTEAEKRTVVGSLLENLKSEDKALAKDFGSFLERLQDRPIVAPTKNAAEALRETSNSYVRYLENVRTKARERVEQQQLARTQASKMTVMVDRADAERLVKVWEGAGAKPTNHPTMIKKGEGVAFVHQDLPTVYGRVTDNAPIKSLGDDHRIAIVDMAGLKAGITQLGPKWDKLAIEVENYKVKSFAPPAIQSVKALEQPLPVKSLNSELVI